MRHGAKSIVNFELLPEPPKSRAPDNPWPLFNRSFRTDYGHAEVQAHFGHDPRKYCMATKKFVLDDEGKLKGLDTVQVEWTKQNGQWKMEEAVGSEKVSSQLMFPISDLSNTSCSSTPPSLCCLRLVSSVLSRSASRLLVSRLTPELTLRLLPTCAIFLFMPYYVS